MGNISKGSARGELPRRLRRRSSPTPKAPALRTSVVWVQVAREVRKAAEVPPHRQADSTAPAPAGLRRVLGRRVRRVDQDRLSRLRGDRRAT
jgi:hypothetical protein